VPWQNWRWRSTIHRDFFLKKSYPKTVKTGNFSKEGLYQILFTTLISIAGALIILLAVGTIFGLVRPRNSEPILSFGSQIQTEQAFSQTDDIRVFSGLGRQRIPLTNSSVLILSIAFPYSAGDVAFTEELAAKISDFRAIASNYFSSLPAENLIQINEDAAKREILGRFNASLRLGRITALYFSEMMVIPGSY
jgi:flagellar basal body-associated protein FliL